MRTGSKFFFFMMVGVLCLGGMSHADSKTTTTHRQKKAKVKKPELPALPSGPTGPVQAIPLDATPAVPPHVSYLDGQLTIVAPNSTLGDILRAVRKQTSAEMDVPATATERVVTHLGPGPARAVVADLLNGSKFNYVLLGSASDTSLLTRIVLVPKTGGEPATAANPQPEQQQAMVNQAANMAPPPPPDETGDAAPDTDAPEENADDAAAEQAAQEAEQPAVVQQQLGTDGVKTPQQMLQEMQQRQLQMQQQLAPGQPPIPGAGVPGRPATPETQPEQ